jgi:hypothetical protein
MHLEADPPVFLATVAPSCAAGADHPDLVAVRPGDETADEWSPSSPTSVTWPAGLSGKTGGPQNSAWIARPWRPAMTADLGKRCGHQGLFFHWSCRAQPSL